MRRRADSSDGLSVGGVQTAQELPFHHPDRMERDVSQVLNDSDFWLTVAYSVALHLRHVLSLLHDEGLDHLLIKNSKHSRIKHDQDDNDRDAELDRLLGYSE